MSEAEPVLEFAGYVIDGRKRTLTGPDGRNVDISSRAFDTLLYLATHPHEVVDKQRLIKAIWPTSVVEDNNLNQQISALRKILGETPDDHRFIVTVMGRGYRFVQDVRPVSAPPKRVDDAPRASTTLPVPSSASRAVPAAATVVRAARRLRQLAVAAGAAVVLLAAVAYVSLGRPEPPASVAADAQSIAVLPFADVSPSRDQQYFADGLSEELLNALGKLDRLRVIGRSSSFSFRDATENARDVGDSLGVQHLLEGSVRRDGDRLRITARLVDAANGEQRWADAYDRRLGDVFAIQKEIADSVAAALDLELRPARAAAAAGETRNMEAYERFLEARAVMNTGGSSRARDAIALLERAVELDPEFALAWSTLAEAYTFEADLPEDSALPLTALEIEQRVSRAALLAFELAPEAPETLLAAGMVSMQNRDWAEAERRLRRAVELAGPYDYAANFGYAWFLMNVGRVGEAIPYEERAMRAEPLLMRPVTFLAALLEMRGELDEAEALLATSAGLDGDEQMRRQAHFMINLARQDRDGLRRLLLERGEPPHPLLDDPPLALEQLRERYADAAARGVNSPFLPVAIFASFLGDENLALDALRRLGPTQNVHVLWRRTLRDVRGMPEFAQLVQELGLADYWRASGEWGEFCRETTGGEFVCL
jgi:TolB-like protein/DNA-binding winged helix-turn-helix (wHTH) protein/Tfp pilus assembly protein PilF